MRHLKAGRALGVKPAHRRAMMRNLVTSLLEHEQITTTVARAKEMRVPMEKMITLGKKGDLPARRRALGFIKSKKAMSALFDELPGRYSERPGGYCRIVRVGRRRGDGAEMALIQLVDGPNDVLAHAEKPSTRRRGGRGRNVRAEVAAEGKGKGKAAAKAEKAEAAPEKQDQEEETAAEDKEKKPKKPRKAPATKAEASAGDKDTAAKPKPRKKPAKADKEDAKP